MADITKIKFSNYISLGSACRIAASMSKYGLRSWSGPFDWLITRDFQWVLHYMQNDFADFLKEDNLEIVDDNPLRFKECSSGFLFLHEDFPFQDEYEKLRDKYQRRIYKFLDEITRPTCFLRAVSSKEELAYIKENSRYIDQVIKKSNDANQIVFLIERGLEAQDLPFQSFELKSPPVSLSQLQLRGWFDQTEEFLVFCAEHFDVNVMMRNYMFDQKKESR